MTDTASIRSGLAYGALAFAAGGLLSPRAVVSTYGVADPTPEHLYTIRLWAGALGVVGLLGLSDELSDERYLQLALAMNAVDTVAALVSKSSARTRLMAGATSAGFAAAAAIGLSSD